MSTGWAAYGDRALRIGLPDLSAVHALAAGVSAAEVEGVADIVPSWSSLLVLLQDTVDPEAVAEQLASVVPAGDERSRRQHAVSVVYDGEDLSRVAAWVGISVDEVVHRHSAPTYTVAFLGFAPGFPYLAGLDASLATPRLDSPRERIRAGAVGIADDVTGIYPSASPGGWNLVGHCDIDLFDLGRESPALMQPGDLVHFIPR